MAVADNSNVVAGEHSDGVGNRMQSLANTVDEPAGAALDPGWLAAMDPARLAPVNPARYQLVRECARGARRLSGHGRLSRQAS